MLPFRFREGALISSKHRSDPSAGGPGQEEVFPHVSYAILPLGTFYLLASRGYSQSNCFSPHKRALHVLEENLNIHLSLKLTMSSSFAVPPVGTWGPSSERVLVSL